MFIGEYRHNIDSKGRIIVPSRLRESLGETFVITRGLDNCLFIYPLERWSAIIEKLKALPITDKDVRRFARFFASGAVECEPDAQGRVLLPVNLREYAFLKKNIISIGVVDRIEIWDCEKWKEYNNADFAENGLADKMAALGI